MLLRASASIATPDSQSRWQTALTCASVKGSLRSGGGAAILKLLNDCRVEADAGLFGEPWMTSRRSPYHSSP